MDRLTALARARGGVLTTAQATSVDVDEHGLVALRRSGRLVRVRRNAYVLGELWEAADDAGRLALRTRAVLAGRFDRAAASHESALAMHGLPLLGAPPRVVDLVTDVARVRTSGGVRRHPISGIDPVVADGYRCVPVSTAIVQVTTRSGLAAGLVAFDHALHNGRCDRTAVTTDADRLVSGPRDRSRCERLVALADPACESVGETRTRLLLHDLGIAVRSQVVIRDGSGLVLARVDLLVGKSVVVEFDGAAKYEGAQGRSALVAEKRREDALRALGYTVVRVTWPDLDQPRRWTAQIRRALAQELHSGGDVAAS